MPRGWGALPAGFCSKGLAPPTSTYRGGLLDWPTQQRANRASTFSKSAHQSLPFASRTSTTTAPHGRVSSVLTTKRPWLPSRKDLPHLNSARSLLGVSRVSRPESPFNGGSSMSKKNQMTRTNLPARALPTWKAGAQNTRGLYRKPSHQRLNRGSRYKGLQPDYELKLFISIPHLP